MSFEPTDTLEYLLAKDQRQRLRRQWYEKRTDTMRKRYGVDSVYEPPLAARAKMVLTDWFPDPDVPGVRMRILRGT